MVDVNFGWPFNACNPDVIIVVVDEGSTPSISTILNLNYKTMSYQHAIYLAICEAANQDQLNLCDRQTL